LARRRRRGAAIEAASTTWLSQPSALEDPVQSEAVQPRFLNHHDRMKPPRPRQRLLSQIRQPGEQGGDVATLDRALRQLVASPGDSEVTSQVERLSSNETKIAPSCQRIAAVSVKERSSDIGRLQKWWIGNPSLTKDRPLSTPMEASLRSQLYEFRYSLMALGMGSGAEECATTAAT
jgi:hypothetical protein